jgi:threonylcarbamoyladenosine tRNA methylthiotransferase MtaB
MEITPFLIDMMAARKWLCRHFHIPLQSGDKGVLKGMNRHYKPDDFSRLVESIHSKIPMAAIGVDVIAGFPGEDENAFMNSYSIIEDLPVSYLHVFPFSPRQGTEATKLPYQVNSRIIKERAAILRNLGNEKRIKFYRSCLNKEFSVLAEGWHSKEKKIMKGLSDNYLPVIFPSKISVENELVNVTIEKVTKENVVGRVI